LRQFDLADPALAGLVSWAALLEPHRQVHASGIEAAMMLWLIKSGNAGLLLDALADLRHNSGNSDTQP